MNVVSFEMISWLLILNRFYWFGSQPKEEGSSFGVIVRLFEASGFLN